MSIILRACGIPKVLNPMRLTSRAWRGLAECPNGDVLATVNADDLYMQSGGVGIFTKLTTNLAGKSLRQIWVTPSNDVYVACNADHVYVQTNRTGNFVAITTTQGLGYYGVWVAPNGDRFVSINGTGGIIKQTGGLGAWSTVLATNSAWTDLCGNSLGDKYCTNGVDIYRAPSGSDTFAAMGLTNLPYRTLCASKLTADVYCGIYSNGTIIKRPLGAGAFVAASSIANNWMASCCTVGSGLYTAALNGDVYKAAQGL
jgi:hypothetical protein